MACECMFKRKFLAFVFFFLLFLASWSQVSLTAVNTEAYARAFYNTNNGRISQRIPAPWGHFYFQVPWVKVVFFVLGLVFVYAAVSI